MVCSGDNKRLSFYSTRNYITLSAVADPGDAAGVHLPRVQILSF